MQKKFITNLGLILFLNLLIKPFWIFGIDLTVQKTVGVESYGFYFIVLNLSFLFNILLDMGITNFNNRNIAQNQHLLNKHFSGIVVIKFLLGILYLIVTFLAAVLLGYHVHEMELLVLLAVNQFLLSFILYLRSNISGSLYFRTDSVLSVLDRFLMILFCGMLLWGHVTKDPFRIEWFVYSQTAAYTLTALIALVIVMKKAHFRKLSWNRPFFVMIIKQSFPFAMLVLLMTFYNRLDPVMLKGLLPESLGNKQAGIYASGYRFLDAANMIAYLFAVLLIPIFSRMIKKKEPVEKMLKLSFTLIITISVIVGAGSFFYSYELIDLFYNSHIYESARVFQLLMLGFMAVSSTYIFGTLLTANGSLKQLNIIAACGLLINFIINILLIPRFLALGSAWASLITQFFTAIAQIILVQRIFHLKIDWKYLLTLGIFFLGVIVFNVITRKIPVSISFIRPKLVFLVNFGLMFILSLTLAWMLRLFSLKSLIRVLKEDR